MTENPDALAVLVTRPAHQSAQLNSLLSGEGFRPLNFPTIAITAAAATPFLRNLKKSIADYDIALFVSRNAVDYAFSHMPANQLPESLQLGVIGKGTLQALQEQGAASRIIPAGTYNSEGLLESAVLQQVAGKRIIIFRGQEGRTLLGDTLSERGAHVDHVEVYQRVLPNLAPDAFDQLCGDGFPSVAIFTSSEGLINAFELLDAHQQDQMRAIDWLLISERMRETALNLGHNGHIIIAHNASDDGIFSALREWRQNSS